MSILTALVPARAGMAMYAALDQAAATARAGGDGRTRGQVMADTLLARVTGTEHVDDLPVQIQLVMSADTLLTDDPTPSRIAGYGPIPAPTARHMANRPDPPPTAGPRRDGTSTPRRSIRCVYTRGDAVVAMDQRARLFTAAQRELLILRDQYCRTPYCDAPIRHVDHITPHHQNGPTSISNGQGLCEARNYRKEHPDWTTTVTNPGNDGQPHTL